MSKYNNIKSIPVDSIPEEELATAIKEWAEGSEDMERLLWACYKNGIKTTGCHVSTSPYLGFNYDKHNDKLISLLDKILERKDSQIMISPDGGNPFSGPDWYLPGITVGFDRIYEEEAKELCDSLVDSLNQDENNIDNSNSPSKNIIDLLDFFIDKDSCLSFRVRHTEDDKYIFSLEAAPIKKEIALYFNQLFKNISFVEEDTPLKEHDRYFWTLESDNLESFIEQLRESIQYIIDNYSLEPPTSEDEILNFQQLGRFKRRQFGDSLEGQAKFDEWLKEKSKEFDDAIKKQKQS